MGDILERMKIEELLAFFQLCSLQFLKATLQWTDEKSLEFLSGFYFLILWDRASD